MAPGGTAATALGAAVDEVDVVIGDVDGRPKAGSSFATAVASALIARLAGRTSELTAGEREQAALIVRDATSWTDLQAELRRLLDAEAAFQRQRVGYEIREQLLLDGAGLTPADAPPTFGRGLLAKPT